MTPLLFALAAASLAAGGAMAAPAPQKLGPNIPPSAPLTGACAKLNSQTVAPDGVKLFKKLNELPKGLLEHAVWRTVSGCPVREIVFQGETYYVVSGNPRVERLEPDARAPR